MGRLVVLSYLLTMEIVLSLHALRATILSSVVHTICLEMTSKFSTLF